MPSAASSAARLVVSPCTPALLTTGAEAGKPASPWSTRTVPMLTTLPPRPCSRAARTKDWVVMYVPLRLWVRKPSSSSSVTSVKGFDAKVPALFTRTSTLPNRSSAVRTRASPVVRSAMVPATQAVRSGWPSPAAALASRSASRPLRTTLAPSARKARAMSRPMPLEEPVIRAVRVRVLV